MGRVCRRVCGPRRGKERRGGVNATFAALMHRGFDNLGPVHTKLDGLRSVSRSVQAAEMFGVRRPRETCFFSYEVDEVVKVDRLGGLIG